MRNALLGGYAIVIVSIGCDADFYFWDEKNKRMHVITLKHGSVFIFGGLFRLMPHSIVVGGTTIDVGEALRRFMRGYARVSITMRVVDKQ